MLLSSYKNPLMLLAALCVTAILANPLCSQPPPNDEPCGALPLVCNGAYPEGSFEGATVSSAILNDGCTVAGDPGDVWFTFEADGTSVYEVHGIVYGQDAVVSLFRGDNCGSLVSVAPCSDVSDSYLGQFEAGTYYFSLRNSGSIYSSQYKIRLTCADSWPVNDEPCGATVLTCNGPPASGASFFAASPTFTDDCSGYGEADLWFKFDADGTSEYVVAEISSTDVIVGLYKADDCTGTLTEIGSCANIPEYFSDVFDQGTYYFRIRPYFDYYYNLPYSVELTCISGVPTNDEPCGAIPLSCNGGPVSGNFVGATESFTDECFDLPGYGDVWFTFEVEDETKFYHIRETGEGQYDGSFAGGLYKSDECTGTLTSVAQCVTFSAAFYGTWETGTYYYRLGRHSNEWNYTVELTCAYPAANDFPCDAIPIDCQSGHVVGTNLGATTENVGCADGNRGSPGVWYIFTSNVDGTVRLNTCQNNAPGTDFNTDLLVYVGDCDNLICYDGESGNGNWGCGYRANMVLDVAQGQSYYILVTGHGPLEIGNFDLKVICTPGEVDCPSLGNFGRACNDGDPGTTNDKITSGCECVGVPVADNDEACTATFLTCGDTVLQGFSNATHSMDDHCGGPSNADVWFVFNADGTQNYTIAQGGVPYFNAVVQLFKSNDCENLTQVRGCRDFPESFTVSEAGTYYFRIRPRKIGGELGTATVHLTCTSLDCPLLLANVGDPCDDGDPNTTNDKVTEDCECIGSSICNEPYPAVTGMDANSDINGTTLTWDPIPGSIGCQHSLKNATTEELIIQHTQMGSEVSQIMVPSNLLDANTSYRWRIRCGCSKNPVVAGPWRVLTFSTPPGSMMSSYPNPTSQISTVKFEVAYPEKSTLEVYDLTGRRLAGLYSGTAEPNTEMSFEFDTSGLPEGVYVYRLTTESSVAITKFMVVR